MLTSAEVREQLSISQRTLFRLVRSGQLEASKTRPGQHGRYRFAPEAVADYIERNKVEPNQQTAAS